MKVINPTLYVMSMCWSAIFLNYRTKSILFTLFCKRKEFRKKDFRLVIILVNPTLRISNQLPILFILSLLGFPTRNRG